MSQAYGVSKTFVGVILLPLVGNATEHMTAGACVHGRVQLWDRNVDLHSHTHALERPRTKSMNPHVPTRTHKHQRHENGPSDGGGQEPDGACHGHRGGVGHAGTLNLFLCVSWWCGFLRVRVRLSGSDPWWASRLRASWASPVVCHAGTWWCLRVDGGCCVYVGVLVRAIAYTHIDTRLPDPTKRSRNQPSCVHTHRHTHTSLTPQNDRQTTRKQQVALFVVPFLVIAGWVMGKEMTLEFPPIEVRYISL